MIVQIELSEKNIYSIKKQKYLLSAIAKEDGVELDLFRIAENILDVRMRLSDYLAGVWPIRVSDLKTPVQLIGFSDFRIRLPTSAKKVAIVQLEETEGCSYYSQEFVGSCLCCCYSKKKVLYDNELQYILFFIQVCYAIKITDLFTYC